MKVSTFIPAALIAVSLAGAAQAAAPHAPAASSKVTTIDAPRCHSSLAPGACGLTPRADQPLLAAGYAANPANGAFRQADDSGEEVQPSGAAQNAQDDAAAAPVPEPATFVMMLIGLVLLGFTSSRREAYEKFTD